MKSVKFLEILRRDFEDGTLINSFAEIGGRFIAGRQDCFGRRLQRENQYPTGTKAGFRIELNSKLFIVRPSDLKSDGRRQPTKPVKLPKNPAASISSVLSTGRGIRFSSPGVIY